jgi:hypothetical protein
MGGVFQRSMQNKLTYEESSMTTLASPNAIRRTIRRRLVVMTGV